MNDERHGWQVVRGVECVVCPDCAFTFDVAHEDEGGGFTCPNCNSQERVSMREKISALRKPLGWSRRELVEVHNYAIDAVLAALRGSAPPTDRQAAWQEGWELGFNAGIMDERAHGERASTTDILRDVLRRRLSPPAAAQEIERLTRERDAWKEIAVARADLLVAYRIGSHPRADRALSRIEKAERALTPTPEDRNGK